MPLSKLCHFKKKNDSISHFSLPSFPSSWISNPFIHPGSGSFHHPWSLARGFAGCRWNTAQTNQPFEHLPAYPTAKEEGDMGGKRSSQVEVSGEISPPFCHVFWGVNENGSFHHFAKATNLFLYDFLQLFYIFMFFPNREAYEARVLCSMECTSSTNNRKTLTSPSSGTEGSWIATTRYMNMWNKYSRDN